MQLRLKSLKLRRFCLALVLSIGLLPLLQAQVSGLSYTISPSGQYVFWDDRAGLADNFGLGANLGFGFGEFVELRGTYLQMLDQETYFSDFGLPSFSDSLISSRSVDLYRYGGELRLNLSRGKLLPYLTLGTGIQATTLDTFATNKNIYATVGLGLVLSAADRYTFTLEGRSTAYNFNAVNRLMTAEDRAALDLNSADFQNERLNNWSIGASLAFYLGGRRPGDLTEVDRAYTRAFSNGFRNLSVLIEPTLAKIDFDEMLPYRETWLGGLSAGVDFGPLVGIRAFYLQGMENNEVNLDFDRLAVYGGDFRFKLNNVASGLAPFLTIGGGYIDVDEEAYVTRAADLPAVSQAFASGGGGVVLGLSPNVRLKGEIKALLTTNSNVENLQSADEITSSTMYSLGLNVALGKRERTPDALFREENELALQEQEAVNDANAAALKEKYEARITELETELNNAYANQDIEKAAELLEEKEDAEAIVAEIESRQLAVETPPTSPQGGFSIVPSNSRIQLSPAEFESLIEEILESMGAGGDRIAPVMQAELQRAQQAGLVDNQRLEKLEERLLEMERLLVQMNERQRLDGDGQQQLRDDLRRDLTEFSARLLRELQSIEDEVNDTNRRLNRIEYQQPQGFNNAGDQPRSEASSAADEQSSGAENQQVWRPTRNELEPQSGGRFLAADSARMNKFMYNGMSGFAGINVGKDRNNTFNFGLRWHYQTGIGSLELMPEAFIGLGAPSNFGLMANVVQPMKISSLGLVTPYIGTGFGFMQIGSDGDQELKAAFNILLGCYLNVWGGRLYVDFTGRNLFKNNQLIAGYRFNF